MQELRELSEVESDKTGEILGKGFVDDPISEWVFGKNKDETVALYYSKVTKRKYIPDGFGHIDSIGRGAALWLPPNIEKAIPLHKSLDIGLSMVKSCGFQSLLRGLKFDEGMARFKPKRPHFYLFAIATLPTERGKGVGANLMESGLGQVDSEHMPAFLESSKESNIAFYRRFGFEVIDKISPSRGCPPLWLMWRETRGK